MRRRSFIPTTANGNATNISDPKWVKLESDGGELAPLGPSNDDVPPEEIIAAELAQNPDVWAQWGDCSQLIDDDLTRLGVRGFLSLGALSPDAKHSAMSFQDEFDRRDYWAGWLARDIAGLTEPDDAWSWDPSRPVAGQHEAHMAKGDAMLDEAMGFALDDTASREPWHTTEETQLSDACDRAETKLREVVAELVTEVPDGAA